MFTLHWLPLIVGICVCVSAQDVTSRWLLTYTLSDYNATDRPGGWLGCTTVWTRPCSVCTPLASTSRLARDSVRPASSSASLSTSHRWAEQACSAQQWLFLYRPKHYVGQVEHRNIIGKKLQSAQNDLMQTSDDKNENEKKLTKIVQVSSDKEMCRAHQPARTSDDIPVKMTTEDDIGNLKSLTKALDSAIIPLRWIYFFVVSKVRVTLEQRCGNIQRRWRILGLQTRPGRTDSFSAEGDEEVWRGHQPGAPPVSPRPLHLQWRLTDWALQSQRKHQDVHTCIRLSIQEWWDQEL